jgi:hypothetical protein
MSDEAKRLLGGHATDTLTDAERRELMRAALADQETFDRLLEAEGLRELLADPAARQQVQEAIERPGPWERVRSFFFRPATLADLVAVAGVVFVAVGSVLVYRAQVPTDRGRAAARVLAPAALPPGALGRLAALPAHEAFPAGLEVEGRAVPLRVRPGEALSLRLTVRAPARVLVLASRPDGTVAQVWPGPALPPALVAAPAPGGPGVRRVQLAAPSVPGAHRLRLVAAPVDLDLSAGDVTRLASRLTLVDLFFEVERP